MVFSTVAVSQMLNRAAVATDEAVRMTLCKLERCLLFCNVYFFPQVFIHALFLFLLLKDLDSHIDMSHRVPCFLMPGTGVSLAAELFGLQ